MQAAGYSIITDTDFLSESANQTEAFGQTAIDRFGRTFRYVKAGGTTLVVGKLQQSPVEDTNFKGMAVAVATVVGDRQVSVTLGGTATTAANQFEGAVLVVESGTGIGQIFTVRSNDVQATTTGTCVFYLEEAFVTATPTSATVTVYPNPYNGVIVSPTTSTGIATGGAVHAITNAKFGWVQVGGIGACLGDATASTAANQALSRSVTTAGTVTKAVTLADRVGVSYPVASVSAKVEPLHWRLA